MARGVRDDAILGVRIVGRGVPGARRSKSTTMHGLERSAVGGAGFRLRARGPGAFPCAVAGNAVVYVVVPW
jgi:hypothetical protein